jgi:hypothetical protein
LDYYLTNAPTQSVGNSSSESVPAWKIRATVNNQQFIIDRWTPVYLQGFKLGKNLVRLELVDDRGQPIPNVYNDNVSIINYDPQSQDSLAKLIRGEINPDLARTIVDPNYIATKPIPIPTPIPIVVSTPVPTPAIVAPPIVKPVPSPIVITQPPPHSLPPAPAIVIPPTQPAAMPAPIVVEIPKPAPVNSPEIVAAPQPVVMPAPVVIIPTKPIGLPPAPAIAIPSPTPTQKPIPTPTIQPQVLPSPAPASLIPSPVPISIDLPVPATPLAPEVAKIPVVSTPQPVVIPSPVPNPQLDRPSFEPATSIRQIPTPTNGLPSPTTIVPTPAITPPTQAYRAPEIESLPPRSAPIETPTATAPQTVQPEQETWQTKSIELIKFAGVKIRAFTNTIPAKAQRFGQNVQTLAGRAIETIRSWQDKG